MERSRLLVPRRRPPLRGTPCVFPWHPDTPCLVTQLYACHPIALTCPTASRVLPVPQMPAFRMGGALKSRLCRASFSCRTRKPKGSWRCDCATCPLHDFLVEDDKIRSTATGNVFPTRSHITCHTPNIIYAITCRRCGAQGVGECHAAVARLSVYIRCIRENRLESQQGGCSITRHFLDGAHSLEDLQFQFIDALPRSLPIRESVWAAVRRRFECIWIHRLGATLNQRRNWRVSFSGGRAPTRRRDRTSALPVL